MDSLRGDVEGGMQKRFLDVFPGEFCFTSNSLNSSLLFFLFPSFLDFSNIEREKLSKDEFFFWK